MEGFETVAAIAAESKPLDEPTDNSDEQTEAHLAMLSKPIALPSITPSSSSSATTTQTLPSLTPSRSAMGSKDFMSAIGDGSMANILELLNSNKSFAPIDGSQSTSSSSDNGTSQRTDQSNLISNSLSANAKSENGNSKDSHMDIQNTTDSLPMIVSHQNQMMTSANNQTVSTLSSNGMNNQQIITQPEGEKENFVDITEFLNLPQTEAARKLGIPTSTLSKRWKEAAVNRKWPYRSVAKLDKEIMTLLHNIPQGSDAPPLPAEIETNLGALLRKRQDELRTVVIRL